MSSMPHGTKRVRTRRACGPCSARKRKCNGKEPCSTCEGYGYVCSYSINSSRQSEVADSFSRSSGAAIQESTETENAYVPIEFLARPAPEIGTSSNGAPIETPSGREPTLLTLPAVRYVEEYSLEAFPRYLGLQLRSDLTKLESFGWNLGIRNLAAPQVETPLICSMVGLPVVKSYLRRFFAIQFPACGFLDLNAIISKCDQHWNDVHQGLQFEALIATIIGLSCIVAPTDTESLLHSEVDLMRYAESILTDSQVLAHSTLEGVSAMFLRCLYLRSTSTPRITWLTSCNNMHIAENLGLHKDHSDLAGSGMLPYGEEWTAQARACLFWMTCTANRIMSYELGRTPVRIRGVTQKFPFDALDNSSPACLCRLGQLLPLDDEDCCKSDKFQLAKALDTIEGTPADQPYIKLLAADVCFSLFRRIWVGNSDEGGGINYQDRNRIASIGREAVQATNLILQKGQSWWNMLSTLFHFACVLIALDGDNLANLQETMQTIHVLRDRFPKSRGADAIRTINRLVTASKQRKETHLQYLTVAAEPPSTSFGEMAAFSSAYVLAQSNWDWPCDELDWDNLGTDWMNADTVAPTSSVLAGDLSLAEQFVQNGSSSS